LRNTALRTLADTPGEDARAALCLLLLTHAEPDLRLKVAQHLTRPARKDAMVQESLKKAMRDDKDERVRAKAQELVAR
jgi:hypothetical protein